MNGNHRALLGFALVLILGAAVWMAGNGREARAMYQPLEEAQTETAPPDTSSPNSTEPPPLAWLRVEVETSWGWFWQKSTATAYVMENRITRRRLKAGKLCLRLEAHDITENCVENADSLVVTERKRGIAIPKRTAVATAWAENPDLEETSVALEP